MQDGDTKMSLVTRGQCCPALGEDAVQWHRDRGAPAMLTGTGSSKGLPNLWKAHVYEVAFMQLAFSIWILGHYMIHLFCMYKMHYKNRKDINSCGISTNYCKKLASFLLFSLLTLSLLSSYSLKSLLKPEYQRQLHITNAKIISSNEQHNSIEFCFPKHNISESHYFSSARHVVGQPSTHLSLVLGQENYIHVGYWDFSTGTYPAYISPSLSLSCFDMLDLKNITMGHINSVSTLWMLCPVTGGTCLDVCVKHKHHRCCSHYRIISASFPWK